MAKLFANLDRLRELPTPNIVSAAKPINYNAQPPKIKTNFANNISLADRLSQPNLRTTNHLPEFFLSDNYTGFLRIQPFGVYEHKSLIVVKRPVASVAQGETDSTQAISSITTRQGVVVINGVELSTVRLNTPAVNVSQGIIQSNNVLNSIIQVQAPTAKVSQGIIEINNKQTSIINVVGIATTPNQGSVDIAKPNPIINQGIGINPVQPIQNVGSLQGILATNVTAINPIASRDANNFLTFIDVVDVKKAKMGAAKALEQRESKKTAAVPTLQILQYEGDRLLAKVTPTVKHGTTLQQTPTIKIGANDVFDPSLAPTQAYLDGAGKNDLKRRDERLSFISDVLDSDVISSTENSALRSLMGDNYPLGEKTTTLNPVNDDTAKQFDPESTIHNPSLQNAYNNKPNTPGIISELGRQNPDSNTIDNNIVLPKVPTGYTRLNKNKQLESPKNWVLVSYKDGALIEDQINSYKILADRIKEKQNNQTYYRGKETVVKIARVSEGGGVVGFTAFITSLSDNTNPAYQDNQPVGRQDVIKVFKGVTRQISVSFKAVALGNETLADHSVSDEFNSSKQTAAVLASKVNKLQQIAGIGTVQADAAYTYGPTLAISIAGLYRNVICTANSIKIDVPIADTPWETNGAVLPMYYDISMDFSILTANDGQAFNTNQNYIGYGK